MSMLAVSVRILEKDETLKLVYQPSQKFGQGIGNGRDSAIPEVTYSGSLVPPRGCRGKIEELLLRVKEGKMCGKS